LDSLSHIVIGAAIGEVFLGKKIGRWGMLVGAIAKSLPDFDLFYTGLNDPRAYMCEHRAHTHSLIVEALYAIPIAWLLMKIFKNKISFSRMYVFMMVCLWDILYSTGVPISEHNYYFHSRTKAIPSIRSQ
jgi:inner membrane protein